MMRATLLLLAALLPANAVAQNANVKEAERLAAQALATSASDPAAALAAAKKALALTAEFVPTAFVAAGRKGEVVEDEYQAARTAYRKHRAPVYEAVGAALAAQGSHEAAARYLRRALALDPDDARAGRLATALIEAGRPSAALDVLHERGRAAGGIGPALVPIVARAVDLEGRPSAQVEIDRARLDALKVPWKAMRDGPVAVPPRTRLSTGALLELGAAPTVFYIASQGCRRCSSDLEALKRLVPEGVAVALVPKVPDDDHALRQVVQLYRHPFPVVLGKDVVAALGGREDEVVVTGRRGFLAVSVAPPFEETLPPVLRVLSRSDLAETQPRPGWNRRAPTAQRPTPPTAPGLLPEGFAPPDDVPAPPEFDRLVEAYKAGRHAEALKLIDTLESDGRLLPPEARLDRAIVLAAMGRRDEARRIVLRIGDARIADAPDQLLDRIAPRR